MKDYKLKQRNLRAYHFLVEGFQLFFFWKQKNFSAAFGVEKGKLIFMFLNASAAVSCLKRS